MMDINKNKSKLTVMKFGGSCLSDKNSFSQISSIIKKYLNQSKIIIVTSALKGITDKLIEYYLKSSEKENNSIIILDEILLIHTNLINQLFAGNEEYKNKALKFLRESGSELMQLGKVINLLRPSKNLQDIIASYGEKLSTYMLKCYLDSLNFNAVFVSSDEIIMTDDNFGRALPLLEETEALIKQKVIPFLTSESEKIICVTGFYGSTRDRKITTLGRGGSDLTAAILAYSLRNDFDSKIVYWKDVKGFLNVDPKISTKTKILNHLSYIEAKELAFFGSKVLHPLCLDVAEKGNIPSEIRSFNEPESNEFTRISSEIIKDEKIIKAIASIYRLSMVTIESGTMISLPGTASKLFSLLGANDINIKFISQSSSENNITFGIDIEDSMKVSYLLRNSEFFGKQWFSIKIDNDISLISIIGAGMMHTPGIAGKIFTTLGNNGINVKAIAQGSSELNITVIIDRKDCKKAVNVLYDAFINQD